MLANYVNGGSGAAAGQAAGIPNVCVLHTHGLESFGSVEKRK